MRCRLIFPPIEALGGASFAMKSSRYLQCRSLFFEQLILLPRGMAIVHHSYAVLSTFVALRRLKAICLKRVSMAFFINFVNLARKAFVV